MNQFSADFRASGKSNFIDIRVSRDQAADASRTCDQVEYAIRKKTGFMEQLCSTDHREWCNA